MVAITYNYNNQFFFYDIKLNKLNRNFHYFYYLDKKNFLIILSFIHLFDVSKKVKYCFILYNLYF